MKKKKMKLTVNHFQKILDGMPKKHGPFKISCKTCGDTEISVGALTEILKIHEEILESRRAVLDMMVFGTGYKFIGKPKTKLGARIAKASK